MVMKTHGLFDAHFHIVDPRFPLVANAGYLPDTFTVAETLREIVRINPRALIFGTDLPGTRAPRRFAPSDIQCLWDTIGDEASVRRALFENAVRLYRPAESDGELRE